MAKQVQFRRLSSDEMASFVGADGELIVNKITKNIHVHDGATAGGNPLAKGNDEGKALDSLKFDGKSLDEIKVIIAEYINENDNDDDIFDSGWQEFTFKNTGGGNKGAIYKVTVDFDIKYALAFLKYKKNGFIFSVSSVGANMVSRGDNRDYGAIIVVNGNTVGVGVGEDGLPLGDSATIFDDDEGLDTFGEGSNKPLDADEFKVRVIVFREK